MARLGLTYRIYKVRVELLCVGATARLSESEMVQTIGGRYSSQIIEAFDHVGKLHLCGDVEQNTQLPASDARDLLCRVLESQIDHQSLGIGRRTEGYADLEGGIVKDIGLDDVHVLETGDGSVEVGGASRVADDSEDSGIGSTRLEARE